MPARTVVQLLFIAGIVPASVLPAHPAVITTHGKAETDIQRGVEVKPTSTGTVCVRTVAGNGKADIVAPPTSECFVEKSTILTFPSGEKTALKTEILGVGRTKNKFTVNMNRRVPDSDRLRSRAEDDGTISFAFAGWESFIGGDPFDIDSTQVEQTASAGVDRTRNDAPYGIAAAQSKDPLLFDFSTPGTLGFNYFLGDDEVTLDPDTGQPLSELSIFSDDLKGRAHLDFSAGFTGLSYNSMPLNEQLFLLTIDARGIVSSPSDLDIRILTWEGLGLSPSLEDDIVSYLRANFSILPDGSVGLMPGERIALIGPGSPLSTLTFAYDAGEVSSESSVVSISASVPEPGTIALILSGLAILLAFRKHDPQK